MRWETLSTAKCFGCQVKQVRHESPVLGGLHAVFSVIIPPKGSDASPIPRIYFLSGLTCTDQNFIQKAGACRSASKHRVIVIVPDTSPRGAGVIGEDDAYDFGTGAGFYVNATKESYKKYYRMYDYVIDELPKVVDEVIGSWGIETQGVASLMGHSMGGHGALICALKNPGKYRSVSAFAPIAHPSACPWGQKAFEGYLGTVEEGRVAYDATELVQDWERVRACCLDDILIDQGSEDIFLHQGQLRVNDFIDACKVSGQQVTFRMQDGYDHSYFFVQTFIDDHIAFHASRLYNREG